VSAARRGALDPWRFDRNRAARAVRSRREAPNERARRDCAGDPALAPYLNAVEEGEASARLGDCWRRRGAAGLAHRAPPAGRSRRQHPEADLEDLHGATLLRLQLHLLGVRAGDHPPMSSFADYVAVAAYNACSAFLMAREPSARACVTACATCCARRRARHLAGRRARAPVRSRGLERPQPGDDEGRLDEAALEVAVTTGASRRASRNSSREWSRRWRAVPGRAPGGRARPGARRARRAAGGVARDGAERPSAHRGASRPTGAPRRSPASSCARRSPGCGPRSASWCPTSAPRSCSTCATRGWRPAGGADRLGRRDGGGGRRRGRDARGGAPGGGARAALGRPAHRPTPRPLPQQVINLRKSAGSGSPAGCEVCCPRWEDDPGFSLLRVES